MRCMILINVLFLFNFISQIYYEVGEKYFNKADRIIPVNWRKLGDQVILIRLGDNQAFIKIFRRELKLTDLVYSIEVDVDDFTDTHKLREAIYS